MAPVVERERRQSDGNPQRTGARHSTGAIRGKRGRGIKISDGTLINTADGTETAKFWEFDS